MTVGETSRASRLLVCMPKVLCSRRYPGLAVQVSHVQENVGRPNVSRPVFNGRVEASAPDSN